MNRIEELKRAIAGRKRLLVLFSGGLDSSLLAKLAYDALGSEAAALTIDSDVVPRSEAAASHEIASDIGIRQHVVRLNEMERDYFIANPPDRCYHCRKSRDGIAWRWAREHGFECLQTA